jgi:hypothetical protein
VHGNDCMFKEAEPHLSSFIALNNMKITTHLYIQSPTVSQMTPMLTPLCCKLTRSHLRRRHDAAQAECTGTTAAAPEFWERRTPDIKRQQPLAPLQAPQLLLLLLMLVLLDSRPRSPARAGSPAQARPPVQVQSTCTGNTARSATPSWPANS